LIDVSKPGVAEGIRRSAPWLRLSCSRRGGRRVEAVTPRSLRENTAFVPSASAPEVPASRSATGLRPPQILVDHADQNETVRDDAQRVEPRAVGIAPVQDDGEQPRYALDRKRGEEIEEETIARAPLEAQEEQRRGRRRHRDRPVEEVRHGGLNPSR
jgi:hypothetical protein